jgi:hypothetical protein
MSTVQRNDACVLAVDPVVGETLRTQTLRVLESNHYYFEELLEFGPDAQHALSVIYRDAFTVLDALGWHPDPDASIVDVPLTAGHIDQLRRRRYDLAHTNIDRLPAPREPIPAQTQQAIAVDREAIGHLTTLIARFDDA